MKLATNLILFIFSVTVHATLPTTLEKCLSNNLYQTSTCAEKFIKKLSKATCYAESAKIKSDFLRENLKDYCFYGVSEFPNLSLCVKSASLFSMAENHDAALFTCVSNFQNEMSQIKCKSLAKNMKFEEKRKYLESKCDIF